MFLLTYMFTNTHTHLSWRRWRSSLYPAAGQSIQLIPRSRETRPPAPAGNTATTTAWSLTRTEREHDDTDLIRYWLNKCACVYSSYVYHTIVGDLVCLAQPEAYMLVVQKRQTQGQGQQVEEIVVASQNYEHLKQHLHKKKTKTNKKKTHINH